MNPLVPARAPARTPTRMLSLEAFSGSVCLSPEFVRRLVTLGLLDAHVDTRGRYWLGPAAATQVARVARLHRDLGVSYTAMGLVLDLLDRVDELERRLRLQRGPGAPGIPGASAVPDADK